MRYALPWFGNENYLIERQPEPKFKFYLVKLGSPLYLFDLWASENLVFAGDSA